MTSAENLHQALRDLERAFLDVDKLDILSVEIDRSAKMPITLRVGISKEIPRKEPIQLVSDVVADGRDMGDAISNLSFRLGAKTAAYDQLTVFLGPR